LKRCKTFDPTPLAVKLPAERAGLPEEEILFIECPLAPPTRRGLKGTFRPKGVGGFSIFHTKPVNL